MKFFIEEAKEPVGKHSPIWEQQPIGSLVVLEGGTKGLVCLTNRNQPFLLTWGNAGPRLLSPSDTVDFPVVKLLGFADHIVVVK